MWISETTDSPGKLNNEKVCDYEFKKVVNEDIYVSTQIYSVTIHKITYSS